MKLKLFFTLLIFCFGYFTYQHLLEFRIQKNIPASVEVENIEYFHREIFRCTAAEIDISDDHEVDRNLITLSENALETLRKKGEEENIGVYVFPDGKFAYFSDASLIDVAGSIEISGDRRLGEHISNQIFSGRSCFPERGDKKEYLGFRIKFTQALTDNTGIVIIGEGFLGGVMVLFPDDRKLFYFGP
ncbi:hypothetical protein JET14_22050 (plasmid) [Martelella lutilitoris]|uniref:Uncharacterized protein n=1 Tax=Martelella lutilitoris TaxID=2583532 RepID=A0A7T7HPX6_9HYPH|nr:hypothetical protein [Martelella lutilitoris]QQM33136.1 hypothetical protein JET14_22050 [Martelella lutilitoris]QRX65287.1 hypothetical protein JS578_13645 [Dysgonomonadaceae bacterium zrk40]